MVTTPAHDILPQGDLGTKKVALAISVCERTATEQEQLKKTPQALLVFTLEVQSCKCHASQPVEEKSSEILVQQRRKPVCERWVGCLLFPFI